MAGGSAVYVSPQLEVHPGHFLFQYQEDSLSVWVYLWTLTHGGRSSLPDEYRIQMTSVNSPLPLHPQGGYTVLMGYYPDRGMFCGFDLARHRVFTAGSPSVQIGLSAILDAEHDGFGFDLKENQEIAVGVRPDQFLRYVMQAQVLHELGGDAPTHALLSKAAQLSDIPPSEMLFLPPERRRIVESVSRYTREGSFRRAVLAAYDHRCAVTGAQLNLVEAAHILPVKAPGSTDTVANGIALAPTLHRAFDSALFFLDEQLRLRVNEPRAHQLTALKRDEGLSQILSYQGTLAFVPADPDARPRIEYIKAANTFRRVPGYC